MMFGRRRLRRVYLICVCPERDDKKSRMIEKQNEHHRWWACPACGHKVLIEGGEYV